MKPPAAVSEASAVKRAAVAAWRRALREEDISLPDMFRERPECLGRLSVLDLLRFGHRWGVRRAAGVNACAVRCRVNLAVPLEDLSDAEVAWLVDVLEERRYIERKPDPEPIAPEPESPVANYWTGARWLDAPRFAEWLRGYLPEPMGWAENIGHRCREWSAETVADFYAAEQHLVSLGLHGEDIPDECWLAQAPWETA